MKNANAKSKMEKAPVTQQQKQRPEIRDNLDSREGEENFDKGDTSTNNKKEVQSEHKKKH